MMQRILIVDRDSTNAKLLKFLLDDEGYEVTTVATIEDGITSLRDAAFDLIILNDAEREISGTELCRSVRASTTRPLILLSPSSDTKDKVAGLRAGADDYIVRPFEPIEVLARVWALLRRHNRLATTESNMRNIDLILSPNDNKVTIVRTGKTVHLTPIETKIMRLLMSHPGHTITREAMMLRVWGYDYELGNNQPDVYIYRLRSKIEDDPSKPRLLLTVRGVGFKLQPSDRGVIAHANADERGET